MLEEATLRRSLELAVTTEKLGAGFYKTLAERFVDNKEISELFSILAKDEEAHEAQFRSLLEKVPSEAETVDLNQKYQYLVAASISEFFTGDAGALRDIEKIKTRDDALARAFALEKATLLYYHALKDILGEHEMILAVIATEKSHLVSVMKYLLTGAKMRGLSDTW